MNRFKPGDKARVMGNTEEGDTYHRFKIGASVTIVNKDGKCDFVCKDKTGAKQVIAARDLEPIEPVQEEESPWISVEDRLPEINAQDNLALEMGESKPCLVWVNRFGVRFATHYDKGGFKAWSVGGITGLDNKDITHWMPLPKPPISRLKSEIEELKRKA